AIHLGQWDPAFLTRAVQQAQLHRIGNFRENREVRPHAVEGGAKGKRRSRPHELGARGDGGGPLLGRRPGLRLLLSHEVSDPSVHRRALGNLAAQAPFVTPIVASFAAPSQPMAWTRFPRLSTPTSRPPSTTASRRTASRCMILAAFSRSSLGVM